MQTLTALCRVLSARLDGHDATYRRVTTDSRDVKAGDLFVALRGERFDGHDFVAGAAAAGAVGALVERRIDAPIAQIVVRDALAALQAAASAWRARFAIPFVAVTGSNGKTTTKQLLAAVFAGRGPVLATRGNLNNHIGVPLTLLSLRDEHRTAVIEMGANHPGEIAALTAIARPDVGVVTQAGDAHLEGFGSREGVARAKGELFRGLSAEGVAAINADDPWSGLWKTFAKGRRITFGIRADADVRARDPVTLADGGTQFVLQMPGSQASVSLPLPGRHNVMNALAAAACGAAIGLDAQDVAGALARVEAAQGRVNWKTTLQGARLIDDSYNANPTSLRAGLDLLAQQKGQRWAVLGGMAELGADAERLHEECGRAARNLGIERLYALGPAAAWYARGYGSETREFAEIEALSSSIAADAAPGVTVLVKGSRSARMERAVAALCGGTGEVH